MTEIWLSLTLDEARDLLSVDLPRSVETKLSLGMQLRAVEVPEEGVGDGSRHLRDSNPWPPRS